MIFTLIHSYIEGKAKTIFDAILHGDLDVIRSDKFNNKEQLGLRKEGRSPLYYAAEIGRLDAVMWFISQPQIDINDGSTNNRTPLYIACRNGWTDIVSGLLSNEKCDYNKPSEAGVLFLLCFLSNSLFG